MNGKRAIKIKSSNHPVKKSIRILKDKKAKLFLKEQRNG